jgi:hypothetical protein
MRPRFKRRKKNPMLRAFVALLVVALAYAGWREYTAQHPASDVVQSLTPVAPSVAAPVTPVAASTIAAVPVATPVQTAPTAEELDAAIAREAEWAEARRKSIEVQQRLRKEQQAQREPTEVSRAIGSERCVGGQKMKRVEGGWVQAGSC